MASANRSNDMGSLKANVAYIVLEAKHFHLQLMSLTCRVVKPLDDIGVVGQEPDGHAKCYLAVPLVGSKGDGASEKTPRGTPSLRSEPLLEGVFRHVTRECQGVSQVGPPTDQI